MTLFLASAFTDLIVWILVTQYQTSSTDSDTTPQANKALQEEFTTALTAGGQFECVIYLLFQRRIVPSMLSGIRSAILDTTPSMVPRKSYDLLLPRSHYVSVHSLMRRCCLI